MAQQTHLTISVQSQVSHYIKRLKSSGIPIQQVVIFGSQAKEKAHEWSDVDLCVVSDSFTGNRHDHRMKLLHLQDDQSLDIEPHPYTQKDLNNPWDPLAVEIKKHGIEVHLL